MKKLIQIFSFVSIIAAIGFLVPVGANAATLLMSPASGTYAKGSTIKVNVMVDTQGQAVNAVQANFSYPTDKLQFSSVSETGSALTFFAEKTASGGVVRIAGGTPTPGFTGSKLLASVYFKVNVDTGSAPLVFTNDSMVLLDQGNSNVLSSKTGATFTLSGTVAPSPTPVDGDPITGALNVSNVIVKSVTKDTAVIAWSTNKPSSSLVEFGLSNAYGLAVSDPELATSHELELSTELLTPGATYHFRVVSYDEEGVEARSPDMTFRTGGYEVVISVVDQKGKPVESATVIIFSDPQEGVTDASGQVIFKDISPGIHSVEIEKNGKTARMEVNVVDDVEVQNFDLTVEGSAIPDPIVIVIGVLAIILLILGAFTAFRKIKKNRIQASTVMINEPQKPAETYTPPDSPEPPKTTFS